jgi:glycosyltransferase involved in cell wall biosynthesis
VKRKKLFRISTVPQSLDVFCRGQLKMLSSFYEVVAVSSPGERLDSVREREGIRTIAMPMERHISLLKDIVSLVRLIFLFAKERPEIVHSMTPKAGLLSMVASWITRVPIRMHTYTGLVFPSATGSKQKILILMDRLLCACATYINPEGQGVKKDLIKYHITNKPLHIIANGNVRGIDLEYYNRTEEVIRKAEQYINKDVFTFCFVGRMVKDKGVNELIKAFAKLVSHYHNVRLILVGPFEDQLDPLLPETYNLLNANSNILQVGSQEDVRPFFAASDALVFPSYREGFPNVVLEAGAMELPSIVTDINGSNEIIIEGENGVIIPSKDVDTLYDAMKSFIENPEKVKGMSLKARPMIASRFEQKMIWNELLNVYQTLIANV